MTSQSEREFTVVVYGATGFTGQLVCEYLANQCDQSLRWAVAGRSRERLEAVRQGLGSSSVPELILANADNQESLVAMCSRTAVVLSTVGPFSLYGTPLVAACVSAGTHYVDITGESPWVRSMIDRYHEEARSKQICIVSMSGFDSIPADLGSFLCVVEAQKHGALVTKVEAVVTMSGGASGGTIASIMHLLDNAGPELRRARDPYYLNPEDARPSQRRAFDSDRKGIAWSQDHRMWTVPFLMAAPNTRCVRRSAALQADRYGPHFCYNESSGIPSGLFAAIFTYIVMVIIFIVLLIRPTRRLAQHFLPAPGQGPSDEQRAVSNFHYRLIARTDKPKRVLVNISGGDPGYNETAKMIAEAALCLSSSTPCQYGVITPSAAMGMKLVERLQTAGIRFKIETQTL